MRLLPRRSRHLPRVLQMTTSQTRLHLHTPACAFGQSAAAPPVTAAPGDASSSLDQRAQAGIGSTCSSVTTSPDTAQGDAVDVMHPAGQQPALRSGADITLQATKGSGGSGRGVVHAPQQFTLCSGLEESESAREYRRLFDNVVATLDLESIGQPRSEALHGAKRPSLPVASIVRSGLPCLLPQWCEAAFLACCG